MILRPHLPAAVVLAWCASVHANELHVLIHPTAVDVRSGGAEAAFRGDALHRLNRTGEPDLPSEVIFQVEVEAKYRGFIRRQEEEVQRFRKLEGMRIPPEYDFERVRGLSNEVREKLKKLRPVSVGQASRISGVTPAAISMLMVYLQREDK